MTEQDARWVEQVRAGHLDAYDELVQKYMNKVYYLLYRMIGKEEDAKDLTQECFIRAYKHLHQYDVTRSFSNWLYKIAINLCKNELQKQKRQANNILQSQREIASTENPEQVYIREEEKQRYQQEINLLPPLYRAVLILRYYQELSYMEISESLGITEKDVRNYLYRAKQKLRKRTSFIRFIANVNGKQFVVKRAGLDLVKTNKRAQFQIELFSDLPEPFLGKEESWMAIDETGKSYKVVQVDESKQGLERQILAIEGLHHSPKQVTLRLLEMDVVKEVNWETEIKNGTNN